ncbi:MAG: GerMN domain-containing protein [Clostridia bacterium]|nr:GerMN domain-containing protein [Clostridia bacterium]
MKKLTVILSLCLAFVIIFSSCSGKIPEGMREVKLYFTDSSHTSLVCETVHISKDDFSDRVTLVKSVMERLLSGPTNKEYSAIIPASITLRGVSLSQYDPTTVNIDLGGDYYESLSSSGSVSEELLSRYSIICTLCQFENIKKVKFYVNGKDMCDSFGEGDIILPMGSEKIMTDSPAEEGSNTEKFVTLYFTDKKGKKLYAETRKAVMSDNSIEKTVIKELIKGPVSDDYCAIIPENTQLLSIETTEEVCFVNFTGTFIEGLETGSAKEKTAVYSVVNSLTRIAGIEKVQILIDGKKPEEDKNQLFSVPLERDESIMAEK